MFDATLVSAVASTAFGLVAGDMDLSPDWPAHGWLAALALTSQVVGWLLISSSLPRLPAALISMLLLVQPVGAMALGAVVLTERPSPVQLAGAALILAGVLYSARGRERPADDHAGLQDPASPGPVPSAP